MTRLFLVLTATAAMLQLAERMVSPAGAGVIVPARADIESQRVFGSLSPQAGGRAGEEIRAALEDATGLFRQGKPQEALAALERVAQKHPARVPPARYLLARLYLAVDQPQPARRELEQVLAARRDFAPAYVAFGSLALREGRLTDAELQFLKAASLPISDSAADAWRHELQVEIQCGLAAIAEQRKDWPSARQALARAVELQAGDPRLRQRLARCCYMLHDQPASRHELAQSFDLAPDQGPPETFLALFAAAEDDQAAAERWHRQAAETHPKNVAALREQAAWLLKQNRAEEAAEPASRAAAIRPADGALRYLCGVIARFRGRVEEAETWFSALSADEPANLEAANQLALALVEQDSSEKRNRGLQLAAANVRQASQSRELLATLGWALFRTDRLDDARQMLDASIAGGTGPAIAGYYLARVLDAQGDRQQLRMLLEAAASSPEPHYYQEKSRVWLESLGDRQDLDQQSAAAPRAAPANGKTGSR